MSNSSARGCRNNPSNVLIVAVPQIINTEIGLGGLAPKLLAFVAEVFEQAERVELAIFGGLTHENKMRTLWQEVKTGERFIDS